MAAGAARRGSVLLAVALVCTGCTVLEWLGGVTHQRLENPEMKQYLVAAQRSKRVELGFTPLPEAGPVRVEVPRWKKHYDVMWHIHRGNLSRTVDFLVLDGQPAWSGEQEIHYGPREFTNVDGTHREYLVVFVLHCRRFGYPKGRIRRLPRP